ncbi:MAG: hypothetical protein Q4B09_11170, partial [Lachnospiraceae bacterium]|nr:hypothetical protein [Lachnospiraceae bacterium]
MSRRVRMTGLAVVFAAVTAVALTGCTLETVTYTASQTSVAVTPTPTPAVPKEVKLTQIPAVVVTETPTPSVTETPTAIPTETPTLTPSLTPTPTVDPDADLRVIGTKSEAANISRIRLINATGKDIVRMDVRSDDMENYPENTYVSSAAPFAGGETAVFYYDANDAEKLGAQTGSKPVYRVRLIFADGDEVVIHMFPFGKTDEARLCVDSDTGVGYLIYKAPGAAEETNTAETEIEILKRQTGAYDTPVPTAEPDNPGTRDRGDDGDDNGRDTPSDRDNDDN